MLQQATGRPAMIWEDRGGHEERTKAVADTDSTEHQKARQVDRGAFARTFLGLITTGAWVPVEFVALCGDGTTAIMLRQIIHWSLVMDGEFYKRHGKDGGDGWQPDTGLTERQTKHAVSKLRNMKLIATRVGHGKDNKPTTYYSLDWEELFDALEVSTGRSIGDA